MSAPVYMYRKSIYPYHALRGLFARMRRQRDNCMKRVTAHSSNAMRKAPLGVRMRFLARLEAARWL